MRNVIFALLVWASILTVGDSHEASAAFQDKGTSQESPEILREYYCMGTSPEGEYTTRLVLLKTIGDSYLFGWDKFNVVGFGFRSKDILSLALTNPKKKEDPNEKQEVPKEAEPDKEKADQNTEVPKKEEPEKEKVDKKVVVLVLPGIVIYKISKGALTGEYTGGDGKIWQEFCSTGAQI